MADGNAFAIECLGYLDSLRLRRWATIQKLGYRSLMLEFYTTVVWDTDGDLKFSINGNPHVFTPARIAEIFDFDGTSSWEPNYGSAGYREMEFWPSIAAYNREKKRFPTTDIYSKSIRGVYKFFALSFLGKTEATNVTSPEMFMIWAMMNNMPELTMVYTFMRPAIRRVTDFTIKRLSPMAHGGFITTLAESVGWTPGTNEVVYPPKIMAQQGQIAPGDHHLEMFGVEDPIDLDTDEDIDRYEGDGAEEQGDPEWDAAVASHAHSEYYQAGTQAAQGGWSSQWGSGYGGQSYTGSGQFEQAVFQRLDQLDLGQREIRDEMRQFMAEFRQFMGPAGGSGPMDFDPSQLP